MYGSVKLSIGRREMCCKQDQDLDETTIGYKIDAAYRNADMYLQGSDMWHYWMDEAKRLENMVKE